MRMICNGLLYDTERATVVASYKYSTAGDFGYICEELYKTENGRYFLAGEGGPKTKYRKRVGNSTFSGGEKLIPLKKEEVLEWFEDREIDAEEIPEDLFDVLEEA